MPKTTSPLKAREWAELADQGKSTADIRRLEGNRVDPRTIERAISVVRAQDSGQARQDEVTKQGFTAHCSLLIETLSVLRQALSDTFDLSGPRPTFANPKSRIPVTGGHAERTGGVWKVDLGWESSLEARLLREHIPTDPLWNALDELKSAGAEFVDARLKFAKFVKEQISDASGLQVGDESSEIDYLEPAGIALIDEALIRSARLTGGEGIEDVLASLRPGPQGDEVRSSGTLIARLPQGDANHFIETVTAAVEKIGRSDQRKSLLGSKGLANMKRTALVEEIDILTIGGLLPGSCRACARFWIT